MQPYSQSPACCLTPTCTSIPSMPWLNFPPAFVSALQVHYRQGDWSWQLWCGEGGRAQAHQCALCLQDHPQAAQEGPGHPSLPSQNPDRGGCHAAAGSKPGCCLPSGNCPLPLSPKTDHAVHVSLNICLFTCTRQVLAALLCCCLSGSRYTGSWVSACIYYLS